MARQLQLRKGTTAQHSTFTGALAEVTVDITKKTVVVHDGVTVGGFPLVRSSELDSRIAGKVDKSTYTGSNLDRADKILANQNIANMLYDNNGNLVKIRYKTDTDTDYEVLSYTINRLTSIDHYVSSVLKGKTTLSYTSGNLVSAIFVGV